MVKPIIIWILRIIPALIFLQTLFFKFTGAPEAVAIFTTLGVEPWGRIVVGVAELIVAILLLIPATAMIGAIGAIIVGLGAIISHLTVLGISSQGDGGLLFGMAIVVTLCGAILTILQRKKQK